MIIEDEYRLINYVKRVASLVNRMKDSSRLLHNDFIYPGYNDLAWRDGCMPQSMRNSRFGLALKESDTLLYQIKVFQTEQNSAHSFNHSLAIKHYQIERKKV